MFHVGRFREQERSRRPRTSKGEICILVIEFNVYKYISRASAMCRMYSDRRNVYLGTGVLVVAVERCGVGFLFAREATRMTQARACACVTSTANNMIAGNNEHFF